MADERRESFSKRVAGSGDIDSGYRNLDDFAFNDNNDNDDNGSSGSGSSSSGNDKNKYKNKERRTTRSKGQTSIESRDPLFPA